MKAEAGERKPDILDQITGVTPDVVTAGAKIPLSGGIAEIVEAHQTPAVIHVETPEDQEYRRQTDRFIGKGFHEALQIVDPEVYRPSIPRFTAIPRSYKGVYDRYLAVEPRIALGQLHQLLGIKEYINTSAVTNTVRIPRKPYVIYLQNGPVELEVGTFDQAMSNISSKGVATPFIEIDMVYVRYPELFQSWIDAGSSRYGTDSVPCLVVPGGGPGVDACWVDDPRRNWRMLSRGKKLGT